MLQAQTSTLVGGGRQSSLSAGTVLGNRDTMTLFAFPVFDPTGFATLPVTPHAVFGGEFMPDVTGSPVSLEMDSVSDLVEVVLGVGAVDQVTGDIVELVPISMAGDQSLRTRTEEDRGDQIVDLEGPLSVISVQDHDGIPLFVQSWPENNTCLGLATGEDFSLGVTPIVLESGNESGDVDPFVTGASDFPVRVHTTHNTILEVV